LLRHWDGFRTEYHVVLTDARELNYTVLNLAQSLLEAHN